MKSTRLKDVTFKTTAEQMGIGLEEGVDKVVKPEYHYGLRICLNNEMIALMGIKELPEVGEKMKMKAVVEVCCTSEYESIEMGETKTMDLQIVEMELENKQKTQHEKVLYGKNILESED